MLDYAEMIAINKFEKRVRRMPCATCASSGAATILNRRPRPARERRIVQAPERLVSDRPGARVGRARRAALTRRAASLAISSGQIAPAARWESGRCELKTVGPVSTPAVALAAQLADRSSSDSASAQTAVTRGSLERLAIVDRPALPCTRGRLFRMVAAPLLAHVAQGILRTTLLELVDRDHLGVIEHVDLLGAGSRRRIRWS